MQDNLWAWLYVMHIGKAFAAHNGTNSKRFQREKGKASEDDMKTESENTTSARHKLSSGMSWSITL
eukprot:5194165-Amphidinium_carterae.1